MPLIDISNISADKISLNIYSEKNVRVTVLRLDKIHPDISGNKWFKLKYYLDEANQQNKKKIVTFGGAWSNHIVATAAACREKGFASFGIIRGEEPRKLSETLLHAKELGMHLVFISRKDYHLKKIPEQLNIPEYYFINEGGYGLKGAEGAATILDHCKKENYTHICCVAGTGTMIAGLITAALPAQQIIGFSVLKNNFEMDENIRTLLPEPKKNFNLIHDYHFGGYAKYNPELIDFMNEFYRLTNIPSDFAYTAKMFYAVNDLIKNNFFPHRSHLLLIHSGGLQGNASLNKGTLIF